MEHARYRVKNNGGHDDKWFHMSLGLKEGCPAAPIEFFKLPLFHHEGVESEAAGKSRRKHSCGFWYRFNDLPLIRENAPTKKIRWARRVEQTSKSIDLLLFADDTPSLCRRSNMQNRKEILKQTFKNWKLILNDDKWEHIIVENDPEERKLQRKKKDKTARILGTHRNALGTFHHDQKNSQEEKRSAHCAKWNMGGLGWLYTLLVAIR